MRRVSAALLLLLAGAAQADAIIAARNSPLKPMTAELARRIFLGIQPNVDGIAVTVVFQRGNAVRENFNNRILDKTGAELNSYLAARIFTGRSAPPIEVLDDAEVRRMVASKPGVVGYVSDAAVDDSVKVLLHY
jgi:hypothetical protein